MIKSNIAITFLAAGVLAFAGLPVRAEDNNNPALAKALSEATVPLEQGPKASEREGKPISGKYELEDGALQLSVYVMKGDSFNEVIVDHKSAAIKKTEPVEDDDLQQAKEQAQALSHAKLSLETALSNAVRANVGYRAVEIVPTVDRAGKPVASVTLMKGDEVKKVTENLQ
ncbi:MAG: hypothetical protein NVSMB26_19800 [Beijerinckiaceae bacterium]